jgi:hypothetical protein
MSDELSLLNIHETGATEKTRRLITNIIPLSNAYPQLQRNKLIKDAKSQKTRELAFLQDGIRSVADTPEKLAEVTNILAMFKFNLQHDFVADLHRGLYTMLTRPEDHKFLGVEPLEGTDPVTGEKGIKSILIFTKQDTLKKATYGPLVDDNGRALFGSTDIIQAANKILLPLIFDDKVPMPRAFASFQSRQTDGSIKQAWVSGYPLHIRKATHNLSDTIVIEMDTSYAPLKISNGKFIADSQFIHEMAGLTAMLQFGKRLAKTGTKGAITAQTAKQIIMTIQTACELKLILGVGTTVNKSGRLNVTIRRNSIKDMIPGAVEKSVDAQRREYTRINYKRVSDAIAQAGLYYKLAIDKTGILDEISKETGGHYIYIPATDRAAEFPQGDNYKNVVYLKAEKARGNIMEIGYTGA